MRAFLPLLLLLALPMVPAQAQRVLHTLASPHEEPFGSFGYAVAGIEDADGDGRGDLLVGASEESAGAGDAGRAYLFSGATGTLLFELTSPNAQAEGAFGVAVAGVSDVDGDGRGDLLVGAVAEGAGGRAHLFSGSTGAPLHELQSPNEEEGGSFGSAVAGVPDVDGDGRGDLLVGANNESPGASPRWAGRAYVFSGATGAILHALRSPNERNDGHFGWAVAGVEDVDGDGRGDLLVGAKWENGVGGRPVAGRAYLFSGATGGLLFALASPREAVGGEFGFAVAGVDDADGDGRGDLLVGAQGEGGGVIPDGSGRAYLFSGATGALLHALASPGEGGRFGYAVSGIPDADGDGRGDALVGARFEAPDPSPVGAGRAHVFSGASGALLATLASPNEEDGSNVGDAVAGVEDADGDGRGDVLLGVSSEDPGPSPESSGRAYVFSGDSTTVAVEPMAPVPFGLHAPSPNPSAHRAVLGYDLTAPGPVRLAVYDGLGRAVAVLVDRAMPAGRHEAVLDGPTLADGVYLVRLEAEGKVHTRRLTLVR